MSSSYLLLCALRDVLTEALAHFPLGDRPRLPSGAGLRTVARTVGTAADIPPAPESTRIVPVHIGDVIRQPGEEESAPYILLQERGGHDAEGAAVCEILLRVAVYAEQPEEAAHELSNLIRRVRLTLMQHQTLASRYRLQSDEKGRTLPYEIPVEQNRPYAEGYILGIWEYKGFEQAWEKNV